jgi:hypothetical protein
MEYLILPLRPHSEDERGQKNGYAGAFVPHSVLPFGFAFLYSELFSFEGPLWRH